MLESYKQAIDDELTDHYSNRNSRQSDKNLIESFSRNPNPGDDVINKNLTENYSRNSKPGNNAGMLSLISSEGHKNKSMLDKEFEQKPNKLKVKEGNTKGKITSKKPN